MQARLYRFEILAKAQHHGALLLVYLVKTHQRPHHQRNHGDNAQQRTGKDRTAAGTTGGRTTAATKQTTQFFL